MTTHAQPDLFKTWKELYDRSEEFWSKPMQEMLGTETFVSWMSATREHTLSQQKMSRESLEQYWDSLRIPTKTDLARLAGQVVDLEAKVESIDERLDVLESKLDTLCSRLDSLFERLDEGMTVRTATPSMVVEALPSKAKRSKND